MPQAIVKGAFMTADGTMLIGADGENRPAPRVVMPAPEGAPPVRIEMESWAFQRQYELGNVESVEAWEILEEARRASERAEKQARAAADAARTAALEGVAKSSVREDLERLSDLDKQGLIDLALARRLRVNTRRSDDNLRAEIAGELEKLLEAK